MKSILWKSDTKTKRHTANGQRTDAGSDISIQKATHRCYEEVPVQDADDAKVGVLEESVHNPHETREDADTSVEGSHEDRDIAGTLMIRQDESSFAQTWRYFIPDFYN